MNSLTVLLIAIVAIACLVPTQSFGQGVVEWKRTDGTRILESGLMAVDATIQGQIAESRLSHQWRNQHADSAIARIAILVGNGASISKIQYRIDSGEWTVASMHASDTAVIQGADPGGESTLFDAGQEGLFVLSLPTRIAPNAMIDVVVTTIELLPFSKNRIEWAVADVFPNVAPRTSPVHITVDVHSEYGLVNMIVGGEPIEGYSETKHMKLSTTVQSSEPLPAFRWAERLGSTTFQAFSFKRPRQDGYVVFLGRPELDAREETILAKRVSIIVDQSGSMAGESMRQAISAARECVGSLRRSDLMNVIRFHNQAVSLWDGHVPATPENTSIAVRWLDSTQAGGGTNFNAALSRALNMVGDDRYVNIILFLTDGQSEVDFNALRQINRYGTRVFVVAIGEQTNGSVLRRISNEHNGALETITSIHDVGTAVPALFQRISTPLLKNPLARFDERSVHDVVPLVLNDLYAGEQFVLAGRYTKADSVRMTIQGTSTRGLEERHYSSVLLDDTTTYPMVPRLWARLRISTLLDRINGTSNSGLRDEYIKEIQRLSLEFSISSPYVRFGADDRGGTPTSTDEGDVTIGAQHVPYAFPMPASHTITIQFLSEMPRGDQSLEVVDGNGRTVLTIPPAAWIQEGSSISFSVADLPSGRYTLLFGGDTTGVRSIAFIVSR